MPYFRVIYISLFVIVSLTILEVSIYHLSRCFTGDLDQQNTKS